MTTKRWIGAGLAVFAAAGLVVLGVQETGRSRGDGAVSATSAEPDGTLVYYFHGNYRCATCMKFESYTASVLQADFADAIAADAIRWKPVNVEEPDNAHFVKEYELFGKAVVLSEIRDGVEVRWKNLDQIWDRVADEAGYKEYIRTSLRAFLGSSS